MKELFAKHYDEVKNALDWALHNQEGKHDLDIIDISDLFCGPNSKIGRILRTLLIKTDDFRGHKTRKSRYCINLVEFSTLYETFYGVVPEIIEQELQIAEQRMLYFSPQEIRDLQIKQIRQKQRDLMMGLVRDTGLTPNELQTIMGSGLKLSSSTAALLLKHQI